MTDWSEETAAAQGRAIGEGRLDPRELAEAYLERITAHPDTSLVWARTTPDRARTEAAAAGRRARDGRRAHPLDGVPVSWKDNVDTAGVATEAGSRLLAGRVPGTDAPVLSAAGRAGLVCLGKTHLVELAFSGLGLNPMTATPPNAHDRRRVPGGSSSGAAVSVTARMAAAAVGTDTGGSVRMPAAWNGLVGLKTTAGLIPTAGIVPLSATLDTVGPLARTVEDAALMLSALAGGDPTLPEPAMPARMTVASTVVLDDLEDAPGAAFEAAVARLPGVTRAEVPEFAEAGEVMADHGGLFTEAWTAWGHRIDDAPDTLFHQIEARFRGLSGFGPEDEAAAREKLAVLGRTVAERIAADGPILMPTAPILPPFVARLIADGGHYAEANRLTLRNTRLANMLGLCAITLPLPEPMCGLMLVAGPNEERALIATALAVEASLGG